MLWIVLACAGSQAPESPEAALDASYQRFEGTPEAPLGYGVFSLGDVDLDGADELALAWPETQALQVRSRLATFPGPALGGLTLEDAASAIPNHTGAGWFRDAGACPKPRTPGHRNIANLGDLDGDGYAEVAFGFGFDAEEGIVYVFGGDQLLGPEPALGFTQARWVIRSAHSWALGTDLAAGDFDGDGLLDLAIGAPGGTSSQHGGSVWLISGRRLRNHPGEQDASELGGELRSGIAAEDFGERVVALGDLDGDGLEELGALASACSGAAEGALRVFRGRDLPAVGTWGPRSPWAQYSEGGELRVNVLPLGDVDGDGLGELALGGLEDVGGPEIGVFEGADLAAGGDVLPARRLQTGGDSRDHLALRRGPDGPELLAHDGVHLVRVSDLHEAEGFYLQDHLLAPCDGGDTLWPRFGLLAPGDYDGDGVDELALGEPRWPSCEEGIDDGGVALVLEL